MYCSSAMSQLLEKNIPGSAASRSRTRPAGTSPPRGRPVGRDGLDLHAGGAGQGRVAGVEDVEVEVDLLAGFDLETDPGRHLQRVGVAYRAGRDRAARPRGHLAPGIPRRLALRRQVESGQVAPARPGHAAAYGRGYRGRSGVYCSGRAPAASHASALAHLPWLSPTAYVGRSVARLAGWWSPYRGFCDVIDETPRRTPSYPTSGGVRRPPRNALYFFLTSAVGGDPRRGQVSDRVGRRLRALPHDEVAGAVERRGRQEAAVGYHGS
jgi:hypothetical protein